MTNNKQKQISQIGMTSQSAGDITDKKPPWWWTLNAVSVKLTQRTQHNQRGDHKVKGELGLQKWMTLYLSGLGSLAGGHLEDWPHLGVHGEAFPHAHAEGAVDAQGVLLDADVVLQGGLGLHQAGQAQLGGLEALLQQSHRLADLRHLSLQAVGGQAMTDVMKFNVWTWTTYIHQRMVFVIVGCFMSRQSASVSKGRIFSDNCKCCHTELEAVDRTCCITQSQ